jgi:hypothetical protein
LLPHRSPSDHVVAGDPSVVGVSVGDEGAVVGVGLVVGGRVTDVVRGVRAVVAGLIVVDVDGV